MASMPRYTHEFKGYSVWALIGNADVQRAINQHNHTPFDAHSTVLYGVQCSEQDARAAFAKLVKATSSRQWELHPDLEVSADNLNTTHASTHAPRLP